MDEGTFAMPVSQAVLDAPVATIEGMLADMVAVITAHIDAGPLEWFAGAIGSPNGAEPWRPMVTAEWGQRRWLMSAASARQLAFRLSAERTLDWLLGDRTALARLILSTAEQAEALAREQSHPSLAEKH